eukprot:1777452-Rhodomonas_salina.2
MHGSELPVLIDESALPASHSLGCVCRGWGRCCGSECVKAGVMVVWLSLGLGSGLCGWQGAPAR